jgi:protein SCO1
MRRFCTDALRSLLVVGGILGVIAPAIALDYDVAMRRSQGAVGRVVDDYGFTDGDGARVRIADFRGKPLLVSFIYTGCNQVCPTTTRFLDQAVQQANRALGDRAFNVITVGFNLPFDNPAAMRHFARQQGIERAQWKFLSPDAGSVERLTEDLGFAYDTSASGFDHIAQVTLIDRNGRVARQIYGDTFDPPLLVGALQELASGVPAPVQDLAGLLERVRVLCTVYDARTGRYRLDYALFIEIFAGLTVLGAIAHYLASEWRRQRRARPTA